jgi:hypothetical protein
MTTDRSPRLVPCYLAFAAGALVLSAGDYCYGLGYYHRRAIDPWLPTAGAVLGLAAVLLYLPGGLGYYLAFAPPRRAWAAAVRAAFLGFAVAAGCVHAASGAVVLLHSHRLRDPENAAVRAAYDETEALTAALAVPMLACLAVGYTGFGLAVARRRTPHPRWVLLAHPWVTLPAQAAAVESLPGMPIFFRAAGLAGALFNLVLVASLARSRTPINPPADERNLP